VTSRRPQEPHPPRQSASPVDVPLRGRDFSASHKKGTRVNININGAFLAVIGGRNPRIHAGFRSARRRAARNDVEPRHGPAAQIAQKRAPGEMQKTVARHELQRGERIFFRSEAGNGRNKSRGSGSAPSQRGCCAAAMMAGMRSWTVATSSLAGTVMMQNVRSHSPF
jgi:hypothetical protein